ncbi:iron-sulfur cluster assembly scaffold protein [bacterium]|nr:iron-sulfur cluster assembly scaffold protein [bacterium]
MPKKKKITSNQFYSDKILKFLKKPKHIGKIKNADGKAQVGNPICGDVMYLYLKIKKTKKGEEIIKDIKVQTYGCVAAIATSSAIAEIAKGKTLKQAIKISTQDIIDQTGSLPLNKLHCSFLALDALSEAIYNYLEKSKKPIPRALQRKHLIIQEKQKSLAQKYKQ